ncbi:hypothetical protein CCMSSC00406_0009516 [Pleurotus cornucopiae]|uniref:Uncharacterized protein n=1 Tax=Pleurotus cornucopiae TaxID=5321 RepID=A0ACB7IQV5_PLECO|nr:hypothetical protein CCMSSC00406_0009516 [Pleurotus cornucopiae]
MFYTTLTTLNKKGDLNGNTMRLRYIVYSSTAVPLKSSGQSPRSRHCAAFEELAGFIVTRLVNAQGKCTPSSLDARGMNGSDP